jgi:hypothetical protein
MAAQIIRMYRTEAQQAAFAAVIQAVAGGGPVAHPINTQASTAYTLQASDATEPETFVLMNSTQANVVTVGTGIFSPPGSQAFLINIIQIGTGQTSLAGTAGMTLSSPGGSLAIAAQYQGVSLLVTSVSAGIVTGAVV